MKHKEEKRDRDHMKKHTEKIERKRKKLNKK